MLQLRSMLILPAICLSLYSSAQISIGFEGGAGYNLAKIDDDHSFSGHLKVQSKSNVVGAVTVSTAKNRFFNLGAQLSYHHRDYIWSLDEHQSGSIRYTNNYIYLTPAADFSFDRNHYLHFQVLLPVGLLANGKQVEQWDYPDPLTGYVYYTYTESTEKPSAFNIRLGGNVYGQFPITHQLYLLAKAEYTASLNSIAHYHGSDVRPADLLFKAGICYHMDNE